MLRNIIIGFAVVLGLVVAGAYLQPRMVHVERSVTIHASAEQIFPYLNDYEEFNRWSPWAHRDPDATYEFSDPSGGVGASMSWAGDESVGVGSQEITVSEFPNHLEMALDFGDDGTAVAFFDLVPGDEGTVVTWGFDTDMGMNPVGRYMGLMMDKWIGADYEDGLTNLQGLVEEQVSVPRDPSGAAMEMPMSDDGEEMSKDAMENDEPAVPMDSGEKPDGSEMPNDK